MAKKADKLIGARAGKANSLPEADLIQIAWDVRNGKISIDELSPEVQRAILDSRHDPNRLRGDELLRGMTKREIARASKEPDAPARDVSVGAQFVVTVPRVALDANKTDSKSRKLKKDQPTGSAKNAARAEAFRQKIKDFVRECGAGFQFDATRISRWIRNKYTQENDAAPAQQTWPRMKSGKAYSQSYILQIVRAVLSKAGTASTGK